jgi:hypothetical protein
LRCRHEDRGGNKGEEEIIKTPAEWEIGEIRSRLDRIAENPTIQDILQRLEGLESRIYDLEDRIDSLER